MESNRVLRLETEVAHLRVQLAQMHQRQEKIAAFVQELLDESRQPKGKALRQAEQQSREAQIDSVKSALEVIYEIVPGGRDCWFSLSDTIKHLREYGLELEGSDQAQRRIISAAFKQLGIEQSRKSEGIVHIGIIRPFS